VEQPLNDVKDGEIGEDTFETLYLHGLPVIPPSTIRSTAGSACNGSNR
jgi:hypothetical protein